MDKEVVAELIQEKCNTKNIRTELQKILEPAHRKRLLAEYEELETKLGGIGASEKTAKLIIRNL
jgi:lipid-A-disaccharide synthase